ncbi:MAG: type II secretion system protein [Clostridiales bacterium]|nr:type II secretion system protein [Clostridiales bacterium]
MKRFAKIKTKKGFTLLETLLATAILTIIGSMLMEGFITAMGYSYNSSVYARSASYNSQLCINQLAKWSMYADNIKEWNPTTGNAVSLAAAYKDVGQYAFNQSNSYSQPKTISFAGGGVAGHSLGKLRVAVYEQTSVQTGSTDLTTFNEENIAGSTNAYADNRTILFYYPTVNGTPSDSYFGNTHVYRRSNGNLCWGYDDAHGNGVWIADKD